MTHRVIFWLGVSTAALLSGALPIVPAVVAPMLGADLLINAAEAQECGEEGGDTECPKPEGESGEDGEGEGG